MTPDYQLKTAEEVRALSEGAVLSHPDFSGSRRHHLTPEVDSWVDSLRGRIETTDQGSYEFDAKRHTMEPEDGSPPKGAMGYSLRVTQGRDTITFLASGSLTNYEKHSNAIFDSDIGPLVDELIADYKTWPGQ